MAITEGLWWKVVTSGFVGLAKVEEFTPAGVLLADVHVFEPDVPPEHLQEFQTLLLISQMKASNKDEAKRIAEAQKRLAELQEMFQRAPRKWRKLAKYLLLPAAAPIEFREPTPEEAAAVGAVVVASAMPGLEK